MKFENHTIQQRHSFHLLISILFLFLFKVSIGQDYLISFSGKGKSTTVDSVKIENLTQNKSIKLSGKDILHLSKVTSLPFLSNSDERPLTIYPNPFSNFCVLEFSVVQSALAQINVFDLVGKKIISSTQFLPAGVNSYRLAGLPTGIYAVEVKLSDKVYSAKLINNGKGFGESLSLEYSGIVSVLRSNLKLKGAAKEFFWQYNNGDRLLYKGNSGKYSTIIVDIPTENKTMSFNFVECTDGDGNNYPVVQIGSQIWMAENLKTTKYNDGSPILNVTDGASWSSITKDAYCWYSNDISNKDKYGALYNWYTVYTNKLAPKGWHVPTDEEWITLSEFLGGVEVAGGKLKETRMAHWLAPNAGANNEVGFTALPAGNRNGSSGTSNSIGKDGYWWTSTPTKSTNAYNKGINFNSTNITKLEPSRNNGYSVRCLLSNLDVLIVNTSDLSDISQTTVKARGNVTSDGVATVTTRGVCWSTRKNPTIADSITIDGTGAGSFTSNLAGLSTGTTYYIRAYATNSEGTSYGNEISFTTNYLLKQVGEIEIPDLHPDDERADVYRIVSLKRLVEEYKKKSASSAGSCMCGLQRMEGFYVDEESNDVFLYSKCVKESNWPAISSFDFIESLKNVTSGEEAPYCSLDPKAEGIEALNNYLDSLAGSKSGSILKSLRISDQKSENGLDKFDIKRAAQLFGGQQCIVGGVAQKSNFAYEMIYADYFMKKVSQGALKLTGVKSLWDYLAEDNYNSDMGMSRFWFNVDDNYPTILENGKLYKIKDLPIQVTTEAMGLNEDGELVDIGKRDSISVRFARGFTSKFDSSALQVDHFAALVNLYHLQATSLALKQKNVIQENYGIFNYLINEFPLIQTVNFPDELPGLISTLKVTKTEGQQSTTYFFILAGGADLKIEIKFQTDQTTPVSVFKHKMEDATKQMKITNSVSVKINVNDDTIQFDDNLDCNLWFDYFQNKSGNKSPEINISHFELAA